MKKLSDLSKHKTIHLLGIGGSGMSAIAKVLLENGHKVSGTDLKETSITIRLKDIGATIFLGHDTANLRQADLIVVSSAIKEDNPEYKYAIQEKMPILKRAEMLSLIMNQYSKKVAVAGTHGKTTTSSMITRMLESQGASPSYLVGSNLMDYGGNAGFGTSDTIICEADESDGSFLYLQPNIGILTNIEPEHMDYYKEVQNLFDHFNKFISNILNENGFIIANKDDKNLYELCQSFNSDRIIYYSIDTLSDFKASNIQYTEEGSSFNIIINNTDHGEVFLKTYGKHNIYNALAALAFGLKENFSLDLLKKGLYQFAGTKRRFQFIGEHNNIKIYDDYGHHPTEIKTTLNGIKKSFNKNLICIFQPHRYTRTRDLLESFPDAFEDADHTIITDVYSANEQKIEGISGELIVTKMHDKNNKTVQFIAKKSEIANTLLPLLKENDIVITMGAGDIHTVSKEILAQLKTH